MIPTLHFHLLGDFRLVADDNPVNVPATRVQSLLAYLVLHQTAPQQRSHLAFLLWPDLTEAQAHANLRKALHHLRQALPSLDAFLYIDRHHLHWQTSHNGAPWTLDVLEIEQAMIQAEQAQQAEDRSLLRQALERAMHVYRGDLLPACYDDWIRSERDRVRQLFLQALERLIVLLERERDYAAAMIAAQRLLRHDPLQEVAYRQLMRLHALCGDRAAALGVYHSCATILERELAAEPSEATRQAYATLLQMDAASSPQPSASPLRGTGVPLIGRAHEWEQIQAIWQRTIQGHPHLVILSGEGGIGKTKVAEEMASWVSRQGIASAHARCYAAAGRAPYAPVVAWLQAESLQRGLLALDNLWLTEIARLVPALLTQRSDIAPPKTLTDGWQRHYFFEALAHAFLRIPQEPGAKHQVVGLPLLLLLDDVHWCDTETLEWLQYYLHFAARSPVLIVGTVRSEETLPGHPLLSFLATLQREHLTTEIALGPLSAAETTSLAEYVAEKPLHPDETRDLYVETEGNPLFVVEMIRAAPAEYPSTMSVGLEKPLPLLTRLASTLPPTVQTVLAARLIQLSPPARELAQLAAVIGRAFSVDVLAHASEANEGALILGLDELWQRRIVREQGAGIVATYDFSHDKLREEAYTSLSSVRRRFLHRRVAEALLTVARGNVDTVSGQIALHYERAGMAEPAIRYYRHVGDVASRIYANGEAVAAFQHAITLLEALPQGRMLPEHQWQENVLLYEDMGDVFAMTGQFPEARQAYQHALTHVPVPELLWQARLQQKTAGTWQRSPANSEGVSHVQALQGYHVAERTLIQASVTSSSAWQHEWIDLQLRQLFPLRASVQEMTSVIDKAQAIVEQYGTPEQRGRFLLAVCARDVVHDRYVVAEQTIVACRRALVSIQQTNDMNLLGFAHFCLGDCLLWSDHFDEAEEQLRAALRVGEQVGNATLLARCLTFLPFIFRRRGQVEEVRRIITPIMTMPEMRENLILVGHCAWVAWRDGEFGLAETYGRMLIENRQRPQQRNSFYWTGIWPFLGVMLLKGDVIEAMNSVRLLLDHSQHPPEEKVRTHLELVVHQWDGNHQEAAQVLLKQVVPLATEIGYL